MDFPDHIDVSVDGAVDTGIDTQLESIASICSSFDDFCHYCRMLSLLCDRLEKEPVRADTLRCCGPSSRKRQHVRNHR